jgi:hypothetical protein
VPPEPLALEMNDVLREALQLVGGGGVGVLDGVYHCQHPRGSV